MAKCEDKELFARLYTKLSADGTRREDCIDDWLAVFHGVDDGKGAFSKWLESLEKMNVTSDVLVELYFALRSNKQANRDLEAFNKRSELFVTMFEGCISDIVGNKSLAKVDLLFNNKSFRDTLRSCFSDWLLNPSLHHAVRNALDKLQDRLLTIIAQGYLHADVAKQKLFRENNKSNKKFMDELKTHISNEAKKGTGETAEPHKVAEKVFADFVKKLPSYKPELYVDKKKTSDIESQPPFSVSPPRA